MDVDVTTTDLMLMKAILIRQDCSQLQEAREGSRNEGYVIGRLS